MGLWDKKASSKGPLEGLKNVYKGEARVLSKKEIEALMEETRKRAEADKKDQREKETWTGKYDPRKNPVGKCRICEAPKVVRKIRQTAPATWGTGPASRTYYYQDGFYCMSCGIRYEFIPEGDLLVNTGAE